jgi:hypothetical protein
MKRKITCNCIRDGVFSHSFTKDLTVYKDKKGEFIRSMGNKYYITNDAYEHHAHSVRAYTFEEVIAMINKAQDNGR